jgi:hypothetical protein
LGEGIYLTRKNKDLYVIFTAKMNKPLTINVAHAPGKATLLDGGKKVGVSFRNGQCTIDALNVYPNLPGGGYAWVVKLEDVWNR